MEGIHFVTNDKGKRVAVLVDLEKYADLWEDFYDALTLEQRKHDKRIPLSEVRKHLVKAGKLRG